MAGAPPDSLSPILGEVERLIMAAYQRGYEAGSMAMRDAILSAATAPVSVSMGPSQSAGLNVTLMLGEAREPAPSREAITKMRAERGALATFLRHQLTASPGASIRDLEKVAEDTHAPVATKSIGNELRRREGTRYRRQGYQWFLIDGSKDETPAAVTAGASEPGDTSPSLPFNPAPRQGPTYERS